MLLTFVLADVVQFDSPVVFVETRFWVFFTDTRTPFVVFVAFVIVKVWWRKS